jgi:hypothetical protein
MLRSSMQIRPHHLLLGILLASIFVLSGGCTTQLGSTDDPISSQSSPRPHIIAIVDGTPITDAQIRDDLGERGGREALIDLVLDHQLEAEIDRRGLEITPEDLERERMLLITTLAGTNPAQIDYALVDSIRSTRRLGPNRYPRFLRRNAMLRALVSETATPSEAEFLLAQQIAFGPKYRIRLFVNEDQSTVIDLRERVLDGEPNARRWIFADTCTIKSIHPSADRGGLIPDLNIDDPSYPSVITDAIRDAEPASLSVVLATDAGYALVLVESVSPATTPTEEQIQSLRLRLSLRKQRLEMQRLAAEFIAQAQVSVTDPSLNWAWNHAR